MHRADILGVAISLLTLFSSAWAQEDVPLIVPPYLRRNELDEHIRRYQANPKLRENNPTQRLSDAGYHQKLKKGSGAYIKWIRQYRLNDELQLSDEQFRRLSTIRYLTPVDLFDRRSVPLQKAEVEAFVERHVNRFAQQKTTTNAAVEKILDSKQLLRLKQIGFQVQTLAYPNVGQALALFDREVDAKVVDRLSSDLSRTRISIRSLGPYLNRTMKLNLAKTVLGEKLYHGLVGQALPLSVDMQSIVVDFLEDDEIEPIADLTFAEALLNDQEKLASGSWIMDKDRLRARVRTLHERLELSEKQLDELIEMKELPDKSVFTYSYVVAKAGVTEPNPANSAATRALATAAKSEYLKREKQYLVQMGELLTAKQRAQMKQDEIRRRLSHGPLKFTVELLEFHGVSLTAQQRRQLKQGYKEIPRRVRQRVYDAHVESAQEILANHLGITATEVIELMGEVFTPILDQYHGDWFY